MPIEFTCDFCGSVFKDYTSNKTNRKTICCSMNCATKLKRKRMLRGDIKKPPRQHRKLPLNDLAFDIITPESAYWIGFIMADGCVYKRPDSQMCLSVGLGPKDYNHLEKLKKFLCSGHKIGPFGKHGGSNLRVTSDKICNRLSEFGVVPRKSGKEMVKCIENDRDFWRGVIDGDGSLKKGRQIDMNGSFDLVSQYVNYAKNITPSAKLSIRETGSIFRASAGGRFASELAKHFYRPGDVSLDRKMRIAMEWQH